mgnify:CR=1 FL=1
MWRVRNEKHMKKIKKLVQTLRIALATLIAAAFAILFLLPIVLTISNSFMSSAEISSNYGSVFAVNQDGGKVFIAEKVNLKFIPDMVSFSQYITVLFKSPDYLLKFWNSVILVGPIVLFQLAVASLAAYGFARYTGKLRSIIFFSYIILMLMPYQVTLVPNYLVASWLNLLDSYWEVAPIERNPLKVLLYTCFFPLMVSGPICRRSEYGDNLFTEHRFDYDRVTRAFRRMAWGIAKKVVVADRLAVFVSYMFGNPDEFVGLWTVLAGIGFIAELYFDFSGCMDIVIGASACFGIILPENFRAPFLSRSVQEIWQRWHITLGAWLKYYIMYPILKSRAMIRLVPVCKRKFGKRGKKIPSYGAMFIVWSLVGLWHGNSWKYIIGEGWWFWLVIVLEQVLEPYSKRLTDFLKINRSSTVWHMLQTVWTLLLFETGMLFFRADTMQGALHMFRNMFRKTTLLGPLKLLYHACWAGFGGSGVLLSVAILGAGQILCDFSLNRGHSIQDKIVAAPAILRWAAYLVLIFITITFGAFGQSSFIYFGF